MKILFLDIDGVANKCDGGLHQDKVKLLKWIIERTGCHVVVSSAWRLIPVQLRKVVVMLQEIGAEFAGVTPDLSSCGSGWIIGAVPRAQEIEAWIETHGPVERFVILDDDANANYLGMLVQTDSYVGLTPEIATEIVRRFNA